MTHRMACCCGGVDCSQWLECAPPQITLPYLKIDRRQERNSSAGLLTERTLVIEIFDAVWTFDVGTGCYYPSAGTIDVTYREENWSLFSGIFDINLGHRCPDCLERCSAGRTEFTAVNEPLAALGNSICCVLPCGPNSTEPKIRLRIDQVVQGTLLQCTRNLAEFSEGRCFEDCDKPIDGWGFAIGFDMWLQNECLAPSTFLCRSVDAYLWDLGGPLNLGPGYYNGGFWVDRIQGTGPGTNPLTQICEGAYLHERPECLPNELGNPVVSVLDCLSTKLFGIEAEHYDVRSCDLTDPLGPGGSALCHNMECIDSSKVGAQCCQRLVKCCACTIQQNCDPYWCGGGAAFCDPNPCCNIDGDLAWINRQDRLASTMTLPTVP